MAAHMFAASSTVMLIFRKCLHMNEKKTIACLENTKCLLDVFNDQHGPLPEGYALAISTARSPGEKFEVEPTVKVGDVFVNLSMTSAEFTCTKKEELVDADINVATDRNAFDVLMSASKEYVPKKVSSSGLTSKDALFNDLVQEFQIKGISWPRESVITEGTYFMQVLCNAVWYMTNQHQVVNEAAQRQTQVQPIPSAFEQYVGYNNYKRKKQKSQPMSSPLLNSHAEALFSLLLKPIINSSAAWKKAGQDIQQLGECMMAYKKHLEFQLKKQNTNQNLDHPVRTIGTHSTLEHRTRHLFPLSADNKYFLIDRQMVAADLLTPVFFDESKYLDQLFQNSYQRFCYFKGLILSVPIDIIRYCPGGSELTSVYLVKVQENRPESLILTEGARLLQQITPQMKEFHTRSQKRQFKAMINNIASITPGLQEFVYRQLTNDASASANPILQERMRLISLGHTGIVADLRKMNMGRPGIFEPFFEKLEEVVEEKTAADERRHNVSHLAEWMSLKDLRAYAAARCPDETPIPSTSLLRLQFVPRNPYIFSALKFTSRISVQYKIQRRQLRLAHTDDHFCAAQLRYMKERAVEQRDEVMFFCCDDKAKIPVGEPGAPVSTGVRGKKAIAPVATTLGALDHDMTKASLTPSVILQCDIPESADKSFVRGSVTTCVNDSVFQTSSPFRHAVMLVKVVAASENKPTIMMKFTDGGTDQRNTLEAVKCASICLFRELNLDMLIHARCAPGHSYTNPAERVMSILNIGIQNCALERKELGQEANSNIQKCGSMAEIRAAALKKPELKQQWHDSIEPIQSLVRNRFLRLKLKDEPFLSLDPSYDEEIDILKRHLRELFPEMDLSRLQKIHTTKVKSYNDWILKHCRVRHYNFQIRKCEDATCCLPPKLEWSKLLWLPDPVLDESGEHYNKYQIAKNDETTENDRPSLKVKQPKPVKRKQAPGVVRPQQMDTETGIPQQVLREEPGEHQEKTQLNNNPAPAEYISGDGSLFTAQNARVSVQCIECRKPRVIYCKQKLSERHMITLTLAVSESEYTCGAPLLPPTSSLFTKAKSRSGLICSTPVETAYYSSAIGRLDVCAHCGMEEAVIDNELKKHFKTVLPICLQCKDLGNDSIVFRPYGQKK